jgi:DNA topoisomerase-1
VSGKAVTIKDGRFGPYVTDGETNATLRRGDEPESITPERGFDLLAEKRGKGPTTRKRAAKKTTKATAKKTTAKKTAAARSAGSSATARASARKA